VFLTKPLTANAIESNRYQGSPFAQLTVDRVSRHYAALRDAYNQVTCPVALMYFDWTKHSGQTSSNVRVLRFQTGTVCIAGRDEQQAHARKAELVATVMVKPPKVFVCNQADPFRAAPLTKWGGGRNLLGAADGECNAEGIAAMRGALALSPEHHAGLRRRPSGTIDRGVRRD